MYRLVTVTKITQDTNFFLASYDSSKEVKTSKEIGLTFEERDDIEDERDSASSVPRLRTLCMKS